MKVTDDLDSLAGNKSKKKVIIKLNTKKPYSTNSNGNNVIKNVKHAMAYLRNPSQLSSLTLQQKKDSKVA
jgi:hypothetical protein